MSANEHTAGIVILISLRRPLEGLKLTKVLVTFSRGVFPFFYTDSMILVASHFLDFDLDFFFCCLVDFERFTGVEEIVDIYKER